MYYNDSYTGEMMDGVRHPGGALFRRGRTKSSVVSGKATLEKNIKGVLFVDYVRMIKSRKDIDWGKHLMPDDLPFLKQKIIDTEWYPFASSERMGVAIVNEIAGGDMEAVRLWGYVSIDNLIAANNALICDGNPRESLMRFQVLRSSFFNFMAIDLKVIYDTYAKLEICYGMGPVAEEAASYQAVGFFQKLLEKSGAKDVNYTFTGKSWAGNPATILELTWK